MDTALHITIQKAGDPEKLGALVRAAVEAIERPVRIVVPAGYKCIECYNDDGGHLPSCSIGMMAGQIRESEQSVEEPSV